MQQTNNQNKDYITRVKISALWKYTLVIRAILTIYDNLGLQFIKVHFLHHRQPS